MCIQYYKRNILLDNSLIARVFYNNLVWGRRIFGGQKTWYIYPNDKNENAMEFISEELFRRNISTLVKEIRRNNSNGVLGLTEGRGKNGLYAPNIFIRP